MIFLYITGMIRLVIFLLVFSCLLPLHIQAQSKDNEHTMVPLIVKRLTEEINFDGIPDEPFWQTIEALPLLMLMPVFGKAPTEESIIKIAYDEEYFYVSAWLYHSDPSDIRAIGKKRDYSTGSSDWLGVLMDTFNDKENAVSFYTNPNGLRSEGTVKNDCADPNSDISLSWNTFWDVKTNISERGWSAEYRIPFSSLRYQLNNGKTKMGLLIMRYSAAKAEVATWPISSPDYPVPYWKPSLCAEIEFEGLEPKNPVFITPYITAGINQTNKLNESKTGYEMIPFFKKDAGLDVKYSLTNNLTADITINTDFAQVEADDQVINLTRYSIFFPEKRVFFLEKADVFDFSFLGGNNLFYSRRIGLHNGNPVRIYGGLRLTGRTGKWDVGLLNMQTAAFGENPSENFGVVRTKRKILNANSYMGGIITSRIGMNGDYNLAYGLDGQIRVTGNEYLTLRFAQTYENGQENNILDLDPSRFLLNWQRRKETGFGYDLSYIWSGKSYNPGIGFEMKQDYQGPRIILHRGWLTEENSWLRFHKISLTGYNLWNTLNGNHETTRSILQWNFDAKKGFNANFGINWLLETLPYKIQLGNNQAEVPQGRYSFTFLSGQYTTSAANKIWTYFYTEAGNFYDGWKFSFGSGPNIKLGSNFDIGLFYRFDKVNFPERSMEFANHIGRLTGLMTLTTKTSLSAFIQYNSAIDGIIGNIRFRYNPREGNDFYIVYDEALNTGRNHSLPVKPFSAGRTVLLKYTYTFRL
jgi:hypothetical protein